MRRGNRGQVRIVEAFLAVLIIFSAFTVSANLTVPQERAPHDDLDSVGLEALMKLDSDGTLGDHIIDTNWTGLREALSLTLPTGTTFNLTVYGEQMQQVNAAVISNGAFGSQSISYVEYVCTTRTRVCRFYTLRMELAVAS